MGSRTRVTQGSSGAPLFEHPPYASDEAPEGAPAPPLKDGLGKAFRSRACRQGVKALFLDNAQPGEVAHAVRDVLERRGMLVSEHRSSRIRFRGTLEGARHTWSREGYVGVYQRVGEREVELRLLLRALWPYRIFWAVALVNVVLALLVIVSNPPGTTWFLVAFLGGLALLSAGLVHVGTFKPVRREEESLLADIRAELVAHVAHERMETGEEREDRLFEEGVLGEVEKVRVDAVRKAEAPAKPAGRRFALMPGKKDAPASPPGESAEEKRARLLARKAELEAKQQDREP